MQNLAPIALFVYNRPQHTLRTLKFLKQNTLAEDSRLFIFSDGAKTKKDEEKIAEVRSIISAAEGFKSIKIIPRNSNMGLANSIISGVNQLVNDYGQVIVFEDDLVSSPHTLTYFNDALNRYRTEEKVMHIGAYMYPLPDSISPNDNSLEDNLPETFFYRAATSWGWATWKRAWVDFEPNIDTLIGQFDKAKKNAFAIEGSMNFWKQMEEFKSGKNNSWAIRWYASIFLKGGLTLNPSKSLVQNIGHDGSGVHSGMNDIYNVIINPKPISKFPSVIAEDKKAYQIIKNFLSKRKGSVASRIKRFIKEQIARYFSK
ncbi:MAG: glycosyltransferase [Pedobacter sp.]|nr:glycosyltransferase [Pedobacter sp.]